MGWQLLPREALKDQNAVRLLEPTEIQEIVVLVECVGDVIAHVVRRVREDHHCVVGPTVLLSFLVDQSHQLVSSKCVLHLGQSWCHLPLQL